MEADKISKEESFKQVNCLIRKFALKFSVLKIAELKLNRNFIVFSKQPNNQSLIPFFQNSWR
jgi:hypothetical protein